MLQRTQKRATTTGRIMPRVCKSARTRDTGVGGGRYAPLPDVQRQHATDDDAAAADDGPSTTTSGDYCDDQQCSTTVDGNAPGSAAELAAIGLAKSIQSPQRNPSDFALKNIRIR